MEQKLSCILEERKSKAPLSRAQKESDKSSGVLCHGATMPPKHKRAYQGWSLPTGLGGTNSAPKTPKSFGLVRHSWGFKAVNSGFLVG